MTAHSRASRSTELSLVGMAVIWGVNFSVMKYGTQVMVPTVYNALRMGIACVILLAVAYAQQGLRPSAADRKRLLGLGVLGHFIYQMLFVSGLSLTRAGTAALVIAASPAAVAIVARLSGHERLPMRAVSGIVLSISGVMLVVGGSVQADGTAHLLGDLLILGAVFIWAFYTTGLVPLAQRVEPAQVAAWTLVGGVVPLFIVAAPSIVKTDWAAVTPLTWGAVAYSGILAMVVAYLVWYHGVRAIGPTRTAMFANLQPLVAVLVAWLMLGEVPTVFQGLGAGAVLGGLYLARR
ncbi:MAG: EamA family transporter [Gemmatimonas sp.]|nr:EamA family transporter [Gemmatimonas sp.]